MPVDDARINNPRRGDASLHSISEGESPLQDRMFFIWNDYKSVKSSDFFALSIVIRVIEVSFISS
jgi:hypothetical protein